MIDALPAVPDEPTAEEMLAPDQPKTTRAIALPDTFTLDLGLIEGIDDTLDDLRALVQSIIEEDVQKQHRKQAHKKESDRVIQPMSLDAAEKKVTVDEVKALAMDQPDIRKLMRSDFEELLDDMVTEGQLDAATAAVIRLSILSHESVAPLRSLIFDEQGEPRRDALTPYRSREYILTTWQVLIELVKKGEVETPGQQSAARRQADIAS